MRNLNSNDVKTKVKLYIYLLFLSISNVLFAQVDDGVFKNGQFIEKSVVNLFADNVNIRETPSTDGKITANLSICTPIKIISKSDETYTVNGYKTCWYKISYEKNGSKQTGYVWGGFLSTVKLSTTDDSGNKVQFLYAISGYTEKEGVMSTLKAVINGKIVSSISFRPEDTEQYDGNYSYDISGKIIGNNGLDHVKKIIVFSYLYSACGYNNGDIIVFWNGKELIYGAEAPYVSEAGVFNFSTEFIYPDDDGGEQNKIFRKEKTVSYDEDGNVSAISNKRITFIWDGTKLEMKEND